MLKLKSGRDLSSGLTPQVFGLEDIGRFGILGGISVLAFDPIQSLLAAGTDTGRVYVFGQPGVEVEFDLCPGKPIIHMRIVKSIYLVTVDANNAVTVLSLDTKDVLSVFTPNCPITAIESDPSLDWLFLGLENGLTMVYDVDRGAKTPFRIGNLQKSAIPRAPMSSVLFLALHPRSFQVILIGYENCAIVYSMVDENILRVLQYEVPPGAPGGDLHPSQHTRSRFPRLTTGAWHPNGHHVVTAYEDGSFVFWDAKEGVLLQARTIEDTEVNHPRKNYVNSSDIANTPREPIYRVAWCCTTNPEDTALLIAGGEPGSLPLKGITYMDFGPTPVVQITSYQAQGDHYSQPRRQRIYPVPVGADPVDFIMIPRTSPYYAGNHDPVALVAILSSGELYSIEYPSGAALPVASMFPPSLCWIQPRTSTCSVSAVRREQWIGMMSSRKKQPDMMLTGGAPARSRLRTFDIRNVIIAGHSDGWVRLWDASHGELEDSQILDLSIADALDRSVDVRVSAISFAGQMGEMSVACETGELVYFKFGLNKPTSPEELKRRLEVLQIVGPDGRPPMIQHISGRINPQMKEGFIPVFVLSPQRGPITAVKNSDIGFLAVGYQFGTLAVVELRSMSLIYLEDVNGLGIDMSNKKFPLKYGDRSSTSSQGVQLEIPLSLEFSLMALEGDGYSSIVLSVGTNLGRLLTFRIIPVRGGAHAVQFVGAIQLKGKVIAAIPFDTEYGVSAAASPTILQKLPQGIVISGALIAVTPDEARVIRLPKSKLTSRSFDDKVLVAGLSLLRQGDTLVLVCVSESGFVRIYSIPSLREISSLSAQKFHDVRYASRSIISLNGDVLLGIGKNQSALFNIWGKAMAVKTTGKSGERITDSLYDVMKRPPPRPAISTIQWMSGTKFVTVEDFDLLSTYAPALGRLRHRTNGFICSWRSTSSEVQENGRGRTSPSRATEISGYSDDSFYDFIPRIISLIVVLREKIQ
ncbi:lethal giant larvae like, C-terminal-domain-containing protein [Lipomyces tetrasporus]|uniref:Lethal giant larvae like, C-terminal-domain-containing protein n=1 Tax=Lipomyces tetrasporus TaxID=54092 RepID=A0AAD7VT58_9ASCO|nr:lethal giant larvae like, C-terminal-domain-containing protein [Lipomyces tetrasporus]KAJ8101093.1 lethal giant larvae like, C-terminal-domain-containing protein [Lipomyces tetrasporus]